MVVTSSALPLNKPLGRKTEDCGYYNPLNQKTLAREKSIKKKKMPLRVEVVQAPEIGVSSSSSSPGALNGWTLDSWKSKNALQLPQYPDAKELESVLDLLKTFPPLIFAGETRKLEERIGEAAMGKAFLL